ncbi:MAG: DNA polymerase III subunit delta [Candidatus Aminicenantes bacterium]|nr:DNA polymerase III subunit delta [Candidatus Aminicenantes bacterium]
MAFSYLLGEEIREDRLFPCFLLHGEETYLADEFIRQLKETVLSPEGQGFNIERYDLEETRWADIIDVARTVPFFFSPRRLIVVEAAADGLSELSSVEESILKDYFRSPSSRTVLVVILAGKARKSHPLVRFFLKLPASSVLIKEIRPLKEEALHIWVDRRLAERGKQATSEAKRRLMEIAGTDLRKVANELEKIANFASEKKLIELDDVNQVCDWIKTIATWELSNSLEKADCEQCLLVLNQLFKEGVKEEYILSTVANFFRDILAAKVWLRENRGKKDIFARLHPFIQPSFSIYPVRFREFFALVEEFSAEELGAIIAELERVDSLIKTSDASLQPLLEAFIFDYCRKRKARRRSGLTWGEKG